MQWSPAGWPLLVVVDDFDRFAIHKIGCVWRNDLNFLQKSKMKGAWSVWELKEEVRREILKIYAEPDFSGHDVQLALCGLAEKIQVDMSARIAELEAENERLTELLRGDRMVVATRINHELTTARRRNIELEAAISGCAGQWTPMPEGAHYCGCDDEDCSGEWRIENGGSRLVIGDGESELSIEFYEAIRVCWQVQPSINA